MNTRPLSGGRWSRLHPTPESTPPAKGFVADVVITDPEPGECDRIRIGGSWVARERWLTDDILDVNDKCPEPPEPSDPNSACP